MDTVNPLLHLEELPETSPTEQLKVTPSSCQEGTKRVSVYVYMSVCVLTSGISE